MEINREAEKRMGEEIREKRPTTREREKKRKDRERLESSQKMRETIVCAL